MRDEIRLFWRIKLSKWGVVKLVGSWKLESGVDKWDVREKKKGRLKKQRKKNCKTWRWNCDYFNF